MKDFLSCIESRETPVADIEQGYISAALCILANLSMQLGRSLTWDHAKGMVVGDAEANSCCAGRTARRGCTRTRRRCREHNGKARRAIVATASDLANRRERVHTDTSPTYYD